MIVKICGIQSTTEATAAVDAGANAIGLLLGITHVAEDQVTPAVAKQIVASVPTTIRTVMVTHLLDPALVASIARDVGVTTVQIHGDMPVHEVCRLRALLPDLDFVKSIHVTGPEAIATARLYAPHVDMLLLDSRTPDRLGGTGQTHDWHLSRQIVEAVSIPVLLAGGLTPQNVATALETVRPAGVDANSGLEHADGTKDHEKLRAFANAAVSFQPEAKTRGHVPSGLS